MGIKELYDIYLKSNKVCTDTRAIEKDCVFFALKGANFDANKLANQAIEKGAAIAVIDNKDYFVQGKTFLVDDTLDFLQKFAKHHRKQLGAKFISITGSNGKTTTKELALAVLSKKYKTQATKGNFNNHIGVPLTLLSLESDTEMAIVELGANHQGEIADLCKIAQPNFGYITNFGKAHLEGFGGVEGVIKGKSEIYKYLLSTNGLAFINPQDQIQVEKSQNLSVSNLIGDLFIENTDPYLRLNYKGNIIDTKLIGEYNYNNIRFALSLGLYFGIDLEKIIEAIEEYQPNNNRSEERIIAGNKIILDAYNANPSSVKAALENFAKIEADNKIVILGDMFELGEYSKQEHQNIVELAESFEFDKCIFIGKEYHSCKNSKSEFHLNKEEINFKELVNSLSDSAFLIKGSRGMKLEELIMNNE